MNTLLTRTKHDLGYTRVSYCPSVPAATAFRLQNFSKLKTLIILTDSQCTENIFQNIFFTVT